MKVPTYQSNQVKSADSASFGSSVKTSVETFGGGQANQTVVAEKGLSKLNDIYLEHKKRADQMMVDEADVKTSELMLKLMNAKDGALSLKGKNAIEAYPKVQEEYVKGLADIESKLVNDEQKEMFQKYKAKNRLSLESQLSSHVAQETVRYDNEVFKNKLEVNNNKIATFWRDLNLVDAIFSM